MTITKGKTLGYLAQHQDLHSQTTIYDSLLEVKRPILKMEQQDPHAGTPDEARRGRKLETMLNTYSRLNHEFELLNGYAWQSEDHRCLKGTRLCRGRIFQTGFRTFRRSENARLPR